MKDQLEERLVIAIEYINKILDRHEVALGELSNRINTVQKNLDDSCLEIQKSIEALKSIVGLLRYVLIGIIVTIVSSVATLFIKLW